MGWSWKDPNRALNPELNGLYEPGGWGDVLKGEWLLRILAALPRELRYLDPFCGARDYPLTAAAARRLEAAPAFAAAQAPWTRRGRLASSAALVEAACSWTPFLADSDPGRRATWAGLTPGDSAAVLLAAAPPADLVLWDPYDFLADWREPLPLLLAQSAPVLIYVFNRAPQGSARFRAYRELLGALDGQPYRLGRVPADARLPRAYHEMLLLHCDRLPAATLAELQKATADLVTFLALQGCWEAQDRDQSFRKANT